MKIQLAIKIRILSGRLYLDLILYYNGPYYV